ncbi:MAG TPA: SNF2-related protein [Verrucomicrobiae bacterium]|nr:SNF2-related protein [Verrucomicrobiae bacterium]
MTEWKAGDRLTHRFNPELGTGHVVRVDGRMMEVEFPSAGAAMRFALTSDALAPIALEAGGSARLGPAGDLVTIESALEDGSFRLADGRILPAADLWPVASSRGLLDRLAAGDVDPIEDFSNRLDALHLAALREADGLGSFLGGRIHLFPHQLYVAERATRSDPVRWLLADEVGLGKTVEACLILNHLVRTGRARRTLVVAPETLTVQWLGELWRKYHQVFVLLDDQRLSDVARDFGPGFNPFETHEHAVIGLETLVRHSKLTEAAVAAGIDLLVVDEAHRLERPPGHPGNPAYRAVAPIAALGRHTLLLTATPLEDDAHGFFRLLQLLRPEELPEGAPFENRLDGRVPLPPCTSSTRRDDIGGLPPRHGIPVDIEDGPAWKVLADLEGAIRAIPAADPVARRKKAERIERALSSGAAIEGLLGPDETPARSLARKAKQGDPRAAWITRQASAWWGAGDKTLIFVAQREGLEMLRAAISTVTGMRVGVFHEDLSPSQRDIEVAQFRLKGGPSILISTECGGEGRNFEFCRRLILFDLPWNASLVEQRIGRLDRIGRTIPVEIVYFRPPGGLGAAIARLYEEIGLFRAPMGGLERELAHVGAAIERAALEESGEIAPTLFAGVVQEARDARTRVQEAAYHELHRDPYRPEMASAILSRLPDHLEELTAGTILAACDRLGFRTDEKRGRATWYIEFGNHARVDRLPGVAAGSTWLGSFNREEAVADESIDFFASGQALVEGILADLEESPRGRVALFHVEGTGETGFALLAIYKTGPAFEAVVVDLDGKDRPDWAEFFTRRPLKTRRVKPESWTLQPGWTATIDRLAAALPSTDRRPVAVAAVLMGG